MGERDEGRQEGGHEFSVDVGREGLVVLEDRDGGADDALVGLVCQQRPNVRLEARHVGNVATDVAGLATANDVSVVAVDGLEEEGEREDV